MTKTALITGISSDLGIACALILSKSGFNIIGTYLNNFEKTIDLEEQINKNNTSLKLFSCDIRDEKDIIEIKDYITKNEIDLRVIVNNASLSLDNSFLNKTSDEFRKVIDTNITGTYLVSKIIGSLLINKKSSIINISSTNAIDTEYIESIDYDASKAGIISLTHNFASYYAPNVRVNAIAPGWIETSSTKDMDPKFKKQEIKKIYLNRFALPEDIAYTVDFLSSDKSEYINNTVIRVDGGLK
ncbi:MAG: SDR family oxidoreductase [Bacilli bacterium]